MTVNVKIDKDGRFRVPKAMREELRLEPRQRFAVRVSNGELKLYPIAKEAENLEPLCSWQLCQNEPMSQIELEQEMMRLDARSRAELAHKLLQSLNDLSEAELERLWAAESNRRFEAFERGEMKSYSREEALKRVKAALQ